ncbi:MAG TPA: organomercurial lyase [Haliangiales bacterium]|nr:organomercurial lyase [Haliangiales bacterium]
MAEHLAIDGRVHAAIIGSILDKGFAPTTEELADALGATAGDVAASLGRLADNHGLVLQPGRPEVWIIHPFYLSPANVWVAGPTRGWWAPCLWCGLGVASLAGDVDLHARIGGETDPVAIAVRNGRVDASLVVHFAFPPRVAWDNVVHWCASVQPFRSADDVDGWCARHRLPRGAVHTLAQVADLARRWYGGYRSPTWKKWSNVEAQAIFRAAGLTGPFWDVPVRDERF